MQQSGLRVALFSGNYNYVRDGANQALNRLVEFLERRGVAVRVYSPTGDKPAFQHAGTLVSVPSIPIPRRREYRLALGLPKAVRADIAVFKPNIFHLSAPDLLGYQALRLARKTHVPVVASIHTRFETYLRYYGFGWAEGVLLRYLRHFYHQCRLVYVPSESFADTIRADGLAEELKFWGRGVDRHLFSPARRDLGWRQSLGIGDDEVVVGFTGRLVLEKGLAVFAEAIRLLRGQGAAHRVLVVGEGPERDWFAAQLPDNAVFVGFQQGEALARAYASMDIFFNPSSTETFGNVTLEAMAAGVAAVCADASGSKSLVKPELTGYLAPPSDAAAYAAHLRRLILDGELRARMGRAARDASAAYSWDDILSAVIAGYLEAVGPRPQAAPAALPESAATR